uniref:Diacylglycerol kinase 7-like n=1 Tax=Cicer arietinum TaxID=3827 RepID=A0A3Q7XSS7_CICAR|nr:diacylglycerol kinase 7-like [Cicer arietinum]
MNSPSSSSSSSTIGDANKLAVRSSIVESIRGCGISGQRVDKEELRRNLTMPQYLRFAMRDSVNLQDATVGERRCIRDGEYDSSVAPLTPIIVFINPRSGGRHGPVLKERLQDLMSEEQVFDLVDVNPNEFFQYGLGCLEKLAGHGDTCAKETRERLRIMVAGGDGSVGWVLGCLTQLHIQGREPVPPVGIIPLGTGNDLSRCFCWGGSFPFSWKAAIKRTLHKASIGPICRLDSWRVSLCMPEGTIVEPPYSLKQTEEFILDEVLEVEGELPDKVICYEGVFYNYFSIGTSTLYIGSVIYCLSVVIDSYMVI